MKRLCSALLCLALGCASLAGCSTQEPAPAPTPSASPEVSQVEETYEIGLVQYKEHTALNSLREAFMGRLEEWGCDESQVKIDYQNAGGDPAQAADRQQRGAGARRGVVFLCHRRSTLFCAGRARVGPCPLLPAYHPRVADR